MRLVVQRVTNATVRVDNKIVGQIQHGLMVLVGITHGDDEATAKWLAQKLVNMRIFSDVDDKMNLSLKDVSGSILAISQFTLYGDASKGNRPSFITAARPEHAEPLYEYFMAEVANLGILVERGIFGADMQVSLTNDGPVTIILEK